MVSQAGSVLLVETVRRIGLAQAISAVLAPWRRPRAVHDPGKVLLDIALAVALGGDCLADVDMLRAELAVFGPIASDPTGSCNRTRVPVLSRSTHFRAGLGLAPTPSGPPGGANGTVHSSSHPPPPPCPSGLQKGLPHE